MSITLGYDFEKNEIFSSTEFDKREQEVELTKFETQAISIIQCAFEKEQLPFDKISLKRYSNSYLSLISANGNDFCRIKAGSKSAWLSLDMWGNSKVFQEDERFSEVKKRNQRHWKINLKTINDFENVTDLIISVYKALTA